MALNVENKRVRFGDCVAQDVNARFMRKEQYDTLVANIREDGRLTSVPLLYQPTEADPLEIVSGHHRIQAGTEVFGPEAEFDAMIVRDEQSKQQIIARQISHNSITGEDDLATLKQLYDQLDDVDWRAYSGLDDKTLELMEAVDVSSLSEANLDFQMIQIAFLPHELDQAKDAFEEAKKLAAAEERWLAGYAQYEPTLAALESARGSYSIGNVATALGIVLDVFEAHLDDLQDGWYDKESATVSATGKWVPLESFLGTRAMPAEAAAMVVQALQKARKAGEIGDGAKPWQLLELLAADYLAGP